MNPGREMDRLIAEKVFGYRAAFHNNEECIVDINCPCDNPHSKHTHIWGLPYYSTKIMHAWQIVDKIDPPGKNFKLIRNKVGSLTYYICVINDYRAEEDTAAHAICMAALKSKGVNNE